jgi:CarD family transcriptional regulator
MAFKINEYVVYPLHGVGVIDKISDNKISDTIAKFYKIKMKDTGLSISVPVKNADKMGLRKVIKKKDISRVLKSLSTQPRKIEDNWKLRYQENIDKLKSGEIENIINVVKELFLRNKVKNLSIMERKQYESAFKILVKEISISSKTDEQEVNNLISEKLDNLAKNFEKKKKASEKAKS